MLSRFARIPRKNLACFAKARSMSASLEGYGDHVFKGAVAAPFLRDQGLDPTVLEGTKWVTDGSADKVRPPSFVAVHQYSPLSS